MKEGKQKNNNYYNNKSGDNIINRIISLLINFPIIFVVLFRFDFFIFKIENIPFGWNWKVNFISRELNQP